MLSSLGLPFKFKECVPKINQINSMDNNAIETQSKLKFIARIKEGDKINVRHLYVQPAGWLTRLARTFISQDNRMNTLSFIEDTIKRSFDIITLCQYSSKSADRTLISNVINDIEASIQGMSNLKITYIDDTMYCCKIDTLIEYTQATLTETKYLFNHGREDDDDIDE